MHFREVFHQVLETCGIVNKKSIAKGGAEIDSNDWDICMPGKEFRQCAVIVKNCQYQKNILLAHSSAINKNKIP